MARRINRALASAIVAAVLLADAAFAQNSDQASPPQAPPGAEASAASPPVYKPPLRGAPGGRVGGASRSAALRGADLPIIELLAPSDRTGITARPDPTLYFFISRPSRWPMQFTISAPMQPAPVLDVAIPAATAAGIFSIMPARYNARLQQGIVYTWSVSVVLDPNAWSHNVVASATIQYDPGQVATPPTALPEQRAAALAQAGVWYDAVAAAVEAEARDRHVSLDALMQQVGLRHAVAFERGGPTE
jgi:hypothetical protein